MILKNAIISISYPFRRLKFEPVDHSFLAPKPKEKTFQNSLMLRGVPPYGGSRMGSKMQAYKYIVDVDENGRITVPNIPQIKSSKVEIIILLIQTDDCSDLLNASESSLDFWNNPVDEEWNYV